MAPISQGSARKVYAEGAIFVPGRRLGWFPDY
jgi:hypothetical protein